MAPFSANITIFQNLQLVKTPLIIIISSFILLFPLLTLLNFPLVSNFLWSTPPSALNFQSQANYTSSSSSPSNKSSFHSNSSVENESILLANSPTRSLSKKNSSLVIHPPSLPKKNGSTLVKRRRSHCDIFDGRWVMDDADPIYSPGSCPYADRTFNCFKNGRSDVSYLRYRWQPHGCDIQRFDSKRMMEMLRGKRLVFVGDSLNRNMWQSLMCQLKMFKVSGKRANKHKGPFTYHFKDYNSSITYVGSPFLVQRWQLPASRGAKTPTETLKLDIMEDHGFKYYDADFLIFNTAHWWNHNKAKHGENFFQEGDVVHSKMDVGKAYIKALNTWANWVDKCVNPNKTKVFFLGYTAIHFRGGQWNSGGSCQGETEPITDDKFLKSYPPKMRTLESVISKMKTPVVYLNITKMTDYRKDAHPSIYRKTKTESQNNKIQDCSHWCLPGVPDSWNQLLYSLLLSSKSNKIH